jgi:hypothetical protein
MIWRLSAPMNKHPAEKHGLDLPRMNADQMTVVLPGKFCHHDD